MSLVILVVKEIGLNRSGPFTRGGGRGVGGKSFSQVKFCKIMMEIAAMVHH